MAVVGEVPGTEHYRNINRHKVITHSNILSLRIDESLYFANAGFIEDRVYELVDANAGIQHVILMCTAVNEVDLSALEVLESINLRLKDSGIELHLSEVKGPVMDVLAHTEFIKHLSGQVFLSHHLGVQSIVTASEEKKASSTSSWDI
jgi:SulP family sulfate permease